MNSFRLLFARKFGPLFATQFLGAFNDNLFKNAFMLLILYHLGKSGEKIFGVSPEQMVVLASAVFILPFFLFSGVAGQLADSYEKSIQIRWVKRVELLAMIVGALGFFFHSAGLLLAVLFIMGAHSTFFGPLKYSILPQHLEKSELLAGNAWVEAGTFLAILLGTILGGLAMSASNGEYWASAGTIATAALGILASSKIPPAPTVLVQPKITIHPLKMHQMHRQVLNQSQKVFWAVFGISWFWLLGASLLSLFPGYVKNQLQGSEQVVTVFLALFSIGIGVGSFLCERLSHRFSPTKLSLAGAAGLFVFLADFAWQSQTLTAFDIGNFWNEFAQLRLGLDLLLLSAFGGIFAVPLYTEMQTGTTADSRSQVIAANNIQNAFFMVLASIGIFILLHFQITIPQIFLISAGLQLAFVVCWGFRWLRS